MFSVRKSEEIRMEMKFDGRGKIPYFEDEKSRNYFDRHAAFLTSLNILYRNFARIPDEHVVFVSFKLKLQNYQRKCDVKDI